MNFFRYYPSIDYSFGSLKTTAKFNNLSIYIDLIDQLKSTASYYTYYTIGEYERPDNVSFRLYNDPSYHWTFFLMNDHLRECGWPISNALMYSLAEEYYPNWTLTTEDDIFTTFLQNYTITGKSSGAQGTILARRLDFGQIIVDTDDTFIEGEVVELDDDVSQTIQLYSVERQYQSVHHYYNDNGIVDIDPTDQTSASGLLSKTYLERLREKNDELKKIKVLRKEVVPQVIGEYKRLLNVS